MTIDMVTFTDLFHILSSKQLSAVNLLLQPEIVHNPTNEELAKLEENFT